MESDAAVVDTPDQTELVVPATSEVPESSFIPPSPQDKLETGFTPPSPSSRIDIHGETFVPPKAEDIVKDSFTAPKPEDRVGTTSEPTALPEATFFEKAKRVVQDVVIPGNLYLSTQDKNYGNVIGAVESTARSIFRSPTEAIGEFLKSNAALDTVIAKKILGSFGPTGELVAGLVSSANESPVAKTGEYLTNAAATVSPLPQGFENSLVFNKIPSTIARLPIYAELGAALPIVFGIDSFKTGMDVAAQQGLTESEQVKSGLFYGGTAAAVGALLPMLTKVSEWGAFGKDAVLISRGLAKPTVGQLAKFTGLEAAQQIPLFGAQTAFDNLYSGKPWDQGLGESIATTLPLVLLSGHVFNGTRSADISAVEQAKANIMNRLYATQVAIESGAKKGSTEYNKAYEEAILHSIQTQAAALAAAKANLNESGGTTPETAKTVANEVLINASLNLPSNKNEQTQPQKTATETVSTDQTVSQPSGTEANGSVGTESQTQQIESQPNEQPIQPEAQQGAEGQNQSEASISTQELQPYSEQGSNVGEINPSGTSPSNQVRRIPDNAGSEQYPGNTEQSGANPPGLVNENATPEGQVQEGVSPQSAEVGARGLSGETSVSNQLPSSGKEAPKTQEIKPAGPFDWRKAFLDKFEPTEKADAEKALDFYLGRTKEKPDVSPELLTKTEAIISEGLGPKPPPEVSAEGGNVGSDSPSTPSSTEESAVIPEPERKLGPGAANIEEPLAPISRGKSFLGQTKSKIKELFTQAGNLPKKVFERKIQKDASLQTIIRQSQFVTDRFEKSIKEEFGSFKNVPEKFLEAVNDSLAGKKPIEELPTKVQESVREMRTHIDTLSQRLIREGAISGDLVSKIEKGFGSYLTRSYRKFDDPEWFKKVPEDVVNRAKSLIRRNIENEYIVRRTDEINKQLADAAYLKDPSIQGKEVDRTSELYKKYLAETKVDANAEALHEVGPASEFNVTEDEINGIINDLLVKDTDSPVAILKSGKIGSKDLSILKARKDIAPEIRALYGEYKDPRINYTKSIARMAQLLENHAFLNEIKAEGIGKFLFEKPNGENYVKLAADESDVMSPLNGLYTTPEIKAAFDNLKSSTPEGFMKLYLMVNSLVKYSKTIASPATHGMNILSNFGFSIVNGHYRLGTASPAVKSILADLGAAKSEAWQQEHLKLLKLGVIGEGAIAGELKAAIKDWNADTSAGKLNFFKRAIKGAQKLYGVEDDFFKIMAFYNEKASLEKALPDATTQEIEQRAAQIVRETFPTYSLAPRAVREARKIPLAATFVTWPAEIVRVTANTMQRMATEIKDPNPGIRAMGYRRLAGTVAQLGLIGGLAAAFRQINGVDSEDENNIRKFLPPWTENSQLLITNDDKQGRFGIIDGSRYDPYAVLKKPIIALMRGGDWVPALTSALKETFNPFFSEGIVAGKIFDVARNKQANGKPVYNAQGSPEDIAKEIGAHVWQAVEPGLITSARRIVKGYNKEVSPTGRAYDFNEELLAAAGAGRKTSIDVGQSLTFKARVFNQQLAEANQILLQSLRNGNVSATEKADSRTRTEDARQKLYAQISDYYQSAVKLGVPTQEALFALKRAGLSNDTVRLIASGVYRPYQEPKKYQTGPYATKP